MHQDPDRDRYTSDEEGTVVDNAANELELMAVSKRPTRLLSHGTVVRTNLEPSVQEATPLKKMVCQVDGRCSCSGDNERAIKRGKDVSESQIPAVGSHKGSMK